MKPAIRIVSLLLCLVVLLGAFGGVEAAQEGTEATILFTHDLHSHFLPAAAEDGGEYGGYARLMTVIRQQRELDPNAILVDGGDRIENGALCDLAPTMLKLLGLDQPAEMTGKSLV